MAPVPRCARLCPGRHEAAGDGRLRKEDDQTRDMTMQQAIKAARYVAEGLLVALLLYGCAAAPGFLSAASSTISVSGSPKVQK
jgi:hypothetical protein